MTSRILKSSRSNSVDPTANGGLDEEQFLAAFLDVPKLNIYSQKDVTDKLTKIKEIINSNQDWDKRCLALKEIRSLIQHDHFKQLPDLQQQLRLLDVGLQTSVKDLRSQVVREACITIAFVAREMESKFESSTEPLLQLLVPLMQNSAKVMATSAVTCIKFIIRAVHSAKLVTTVVNNLTSKSNVIRKYCCEFIHIILTEWNRCELGRQTSACQQAVTKGLSDADSEARYYSRKSFASFSMLFPEQGYTILTSFDASKQKQLLAELDDPNLFDSVAQFKTPITKSRGSAPDVIASATPKATPKTSKFGFMPKSSANLFKTPMLPKLTTPQKAAVTPKIDTGLRSKYKVSQSTPASRTGSPGRNTPRSTPQPPPDVTPSRTPLYGTLRTPRSVARNGSSVKKLTSQSQCNSREVSPTRRLVVKSKPQLSNCGGSAVLTSEGINNFSSMRSLPQSPCPDNNMVEYGRNLEAAISDAWRQKATWFRSSDDMDAYSETSSVCSETSSYRSHSDMTEDTLGIMSRLVCGLWTERKDGLAMLQKFLRSGKRFNNAEIHKVLDIIMRMFHDSHPKVLSSFLEILGDLIQAHHRDMHDLLPLLLSRLFGKAVSDVLGNLHEKINRALDAIRVSFPSDRQLTCVCKYITEQPATINIKAKQTILIYFLNLSSALHPSSLVNSSETRASVSKILTWTSEPKNAEVRKLSQSIIVTLARNCPDQLNVILSLMPKTYQDGARKIISEQPNNIDGSGSKLAQLGKSLKSTGIRTPTPKSMFTPTESRRGSMTKMPVSHLEDGCNDVWDGIAKASEELQQLSLMEAEELNEGLLEDPSHLEIPCNDGETEADLGNLLENIKDSKNISEWCGYVSCLISFIKSSGSADLWSIHFKMTYALLLEAIQDGESLPRKLLGLQALREMLERHSERFQPYAELTIMNLLDMEREKDRDVIRASDECRVILSRTFPLDQSIGILNPICLTATYPINMAAVKLLTRVFQFAPTEQVREFIPLVVPGLVKGFEHEESGMRKSSMLCLVMIHKHIGDELMLHIKDLSQNKMKLLNVYIKKSSGEAE